MNSSDDQDLLDAGYAPQLHRRIGFFGSFAVSFSVMSVLMGVFANYGYMLNKGGPFGIWTWLIVGVGQLLVALVFAEMAGRIPLTGALYNWNDKLGHPMVSWLVGWCTIFAFVIGAAGIIVVMMPPLQSLLGITFGTNTIRLLGIGILTMQFCINFIGVRFAAGLNRIAVIAELVALAFFGFGLVFLAFTTGQSHIEFLTTVPKTPIPYAPAFLMSTLLAAWTIFGFESPSELSEETINVKRVAPKSIILSVLSAVLLGFFFVVAITIAIPDLAVVTAAPDPISTIMSHYMGTAATDLLLICVLLAMFACSLLNLTVAPRILFAIARDKKFFAHTFFTQISSHGIPLTATLFLTIVAVIVFLTMYGLSALFASAVVLLFIAYLATVLNFAIGAKKLPPTKNFSLGVWHWPVVVLAVAWLVFEICVLTIPAEFHLAAYIAIGIVLLGSLLYGLQFLLLREKI